MGKKSKTRFNPAIVFVVRFLSLFGLLYGIYIAYLSITTPGGYYIPFFERNLDVIGGLRILLIKCSASVLELFGYQTLTNSHQLLVTGHNILFIGYDCLGFGVMCFFTAFVIAYAGNFRSKMIFLCFGLVTIQMLNISRFVLLSLYWKHNKNVYLSDHHTIFNLLLYLLIAISMYFYIKYQDTKS